MDLIVASAKTANLLFKNGFELTEQGFQKNGHTCFRFNIKPGERVRLERLLNGKVKLSEPAQEAHDRSFYGPAE